MTKPIYVLGENLETFDNVVALGFPHVDFWILVVDFPNNDQKYIKVLPHQLSEAIGMVKRHKDLDLYLLYQGFKDPAKDRRFELKVELESYQFLSDFVGPRG